MTNTLNQTDTELRETVRKRYGQSALKVIQGDVQSSGCCGSDDASCCSPTAQSATSGDPITSNLYSDQEAGEVPVEALLASLGCGNPTALARLNPGETVLDLGSGGGIDVILSARRVGPTGFAYGLDMTDEMLALAEKNKAEAGVQNVKFLKGYIESIPLPDNAVDVIISNCVINLAADKEVVLKEAFRVLKPGGRFAVSDVIVRGEAPDRILRSMEAWTGCIAGALHEDRYKALLTSVGFQDADAEIVRSYNAADITGEGGCCTPAALNGEDVQLADGLYASAFIRGTKPINA